MNEHDQNIEELLPFYALDALSDAEKTAVEAYLTTHPEARAQLHEYTAAAASLPLENAPAPPTAATKQALMARVAAAPRQVSTTSAAAPTPPAPSWRARLRDAWRSGWAQPALTTGALALAALLLIWALALNRQMNALQTQLATNNETIAAMEANLETEVTALRDEIATLENELQTAEAARQQLQDQLQAREDVLALYQSPDARRFLARGEADAAAVQLVTDAAGETAVLTAANLAPLPADSVYQLWLITPSGEPVSGGTFVVDAGGAAVTRLPETAVSQFDAIAVSIEPTGGSPQPTGPIVLTP